ncbi:MAG: hypothetical protein NT038_03645 [Euryarchaeota archaeon]|nr:hypothetical protein [Euryarchaeota archaeon]
MKQEIQHIGEWFLCSSKDQKIIAHDVDFMKIHKQSQKYPVGDVFIKQQLQQGTCFF